MKDTEYAKEISARDAAMSEIDLVRCPKCHSSNWRDIPNTVDQVRTRFICGRCSYTVTIGACAACREKRWKLVQGIQEELKGPRRPVYRLRCGKCGRMIGIIIDR